MKGILSELLRMSAEGSLVILAVWLAGALLRRCKAPARPAALLWLGFCGAYLLSGWAAGGFYWRYYPTLRGAAATALSVSFQLVYLLLCLTPVILDRWEENTWKNIRSEI